MFTRTEAGHLAALVLLVLALALAGTALYVAQFKSDCTSTGGHFTMGVTATCTYSGS